MKFKKLVIAAIAAVLLFVPVLASTTHASAAKKDQVSSSYVKELKADVLSRINKFRAKHHLKPLHYSKALDKLPQRVADKKMAYVLGGSDRHITSKKIRAYFKDTAKQMKYKNVKNIHEADSRTWDYSRRSAKSASKNSSQFYLAPNPIDKKSLLLKNTKNIGIGVAFGYNKYSAEGQGAPYETIIEVVIR